jgi:glycosyltransferase involved in cell wall biosynthesis
LPPAQSGVAEYAMHVLPALAEKARVTVWTLPPWDPGIEKLVEVRDLSQEDPWRQLNDSDCVVYHLGNNGEWHAHIWELSRLHPGVIVLHDLHLQHLFGTYQVLWKQDPEPYVSAMERWHGPEGRAVALDLVAGRTTVDDLSERFPLTGRALENALGVVTHTRRAYRVAAALTRCPIALAGLPMATRARPRGDRESPGHPCRIIVMGFLGFNRGLGLLLGCLHRLRGEFDFRLDIYGPIADEHGLRSQRSELDLADRVHVHGRVPRKDLEAALEDADIAVNLRFPTLGEASWSQLQYFEYGIPTIVTESGWYGDLPAGAALPVRPDQGPEDLELRLRELMEDPLLRRRVGQAGRAAVEIHHRPDRYVERLVDLCHRATVYRGDAVALQVAGTLSSALSELSVSAARAAATEIGTVLAGTFLDGWGAETKTIPAGGCRGREGVE